MRFSPFWMIGAGVLVVAAVGAGCAAQQEASDPGTGGYDAGSNVGGSGGAGAGTGGTPLPPERELESDYEAPVATGHFVWIANPTSGRVAYIDATSLEVRTVEAGDGPTTMAAVPDPQNDVVLVLNARSDDATLLAATRTLSRTELSSRMIPGLAHGANRLSISQDGRWAIAWTDARAISSVSAYEGYQDVSVLDLRAAATPAKVLAVGFRPASVGFSSDASRAFAVTEDGVSVIDLSGAAPRLARSVPLSADPTEDADTRDVTITPSGRFAVVRREGSASVSLVDLDTGVSTAIALSGPVTDLDVTASGDRAVAVVRDTAEVVILPLADAATAAANASRLTVTGELIGSVVIAAGGARAVLYSNAIPSERLVVLDLATAAPRVVRVHAPVLSVFPSVDGTHAVVLHDTRNTTPAPDESGDGGAPDADAAVPPTVPRAFSLLPLAEDRPARIQTTEAPATAIGVAPAGDAALVSVRDDVRRIYAGYLGLMPSLEVHAFALASPPIAVGVVAGAGRGYVAQEHPEGRITFIDLATRAARTLTGFELGARVVDWSNPQ